MGQKRLSVVDLSAEETTKKVSPKRAVKSATKSLQAGKGAGRLADKGESIEGIDTLVPQSAIADSAGPEVEKPDSMRQRKPKERGRRYKYARSLVDRTKTYPIEQAIELVKKTGVARFDGTISAHLNLTEEKVTADVAFPHPTGKTTTVVIATDAVLKKVEAGKIGFDVLLATPAQMPKITKVAKILGPKGLMPNPKNGTITDDPAKRKKELEGGKTQVKTEGKAPLMHVVIGKASFDDKKLSENITALISAVGQTKIKKLTLASTMGPGIKVDIQPLS